MGCGTQEPKIFMRDQRPGIPGNEFTGILCVRSKCYPAGDVTQKFFSVIQDFMFSKSK